MRVELVRGQMKLIVQKAAQVSRSIAGVRDHLHAVAGGNDHALFNSRVRGKVAAKIWQMLVRDGEALAHVERSALVIHANELISHEAANL
jgi:hypothetical protein